MNNDQKTLGAWIISHTNKLNQVIPSEMTTKFDATSLAGKAGTLLTAITADRERTLDAQKVKVLATATGLPTLEQQPILEKLKEANLIDMSKTGEIVTLGLTHFSILEYTAQIFQKEQPTEIEKAAINLSELASNKPIIYSDALECLSLQLNLPQQIIENTIDYSSTLGLIDKETVSDTNIFFNGNLFRRELLDKTNKILQTLSSIEEEKIIELNTLLNNCGCVLQSKALQILESNLYAKLISIGYYDINTVHNLAGKTDFITLPSAFNKFTLSSFIDDTFDLAKMFVSALTYGMTCSTYDRGSIRMLNALLDKLIRGEKVGPATAIGQDYSLLEQKGVVKVTHHRGNMYFLELLKKDIGILAKNVLNGNPLNDDNILSMLKMSTNGYTNPEINRETARKQQKQNLPSALNDALQVLRT